MSFHDKNLTIEIGRYDSEMDAYASASSLRKRGVGGKILLTLGEEGRFAVLRSQLPDNLLTAIPEVERLRAVGIIGSSGLAVTDPGLVRRWRNENQLFEQTYSGIHACQPPVPASSNTLVADIAAIASFFDLPLRAFLLRGVPSTPPQSLMWRRNAGPGDVVLIRSSGKYLVAPRQSVEWQETHTTLERAHGLYMLDRRDYTSLPGHLHPPRELREELPPAVLLTYAALLLRDLANRNLAPGADIVKALTILPDDPNVRQKIGVRRASLHARRALSYALELNRQNLLHMTGYCRPL